MYLNPLPLHPNKKQVGPGYVRATQTNQILTLGRKGTTTIKNTSYIVPGERENTRNACTCLLFLLILDRVAKYYTLILSNRSQTALPVVIIIIRKQ